MHLQKMLATRASTSLSHFRDISVIANFSGCKMKNHKTIKKLLKTVIVANSLSQNKVLT